MIASAAATMSRVRVGDVTEIGPKSSVGLAADAMAVAMQEMRAKRVASAIPAATALAHRMTSEKRRRWSSPESLIASATRLKRSRLRVPGSEVILSVIDPCSSPSFRSAFPRNGEGGTRAF
jgi:hypothetical protein